jgi:RNA polymerase sigma-70 factor (ECF subfamily)
MELNLLLDRCRSGDNLAWEALVREYQSKVYGLAYHYAGNPEDARDLCQEVFIKIYRNLKRIPDEKKFSPWLIRITRNACVDFLRRKNVRPPSSDLVASEMRSLSDQSPNPEQAYSRKSRKRIIERALNMLSHLNREIIILKEIQGFSMEEISELLKVPLGTIKSRSHRARLDLAEKVMAITGKAD